MEKNLKDLLFHKLTKVNSNSSICNNKETRDKIFSIFISKSFSIKANG